MDTIRGDMANVTGKIVCTLPKWRVFAVHAFVYVFIAPLYAVNLVSDARLDRITTFLAKWVAKGAHTRIE